MRWIGHAGLASGRPGGTPTRLTIAAAEGLHVDWLEIDVCRAVDGTLLLRHDLVLPSGRPIATLTADEVRAEDPDVLSIDDAAGVLSAGSFSVLVDLKDPTDAAAVTDWLAARSDSEGWAMCTDDPAALRVAIDRAPRIARWLSLPRVPAGRGEPLRRISANALRDRLPARLDRLAADVGATAVSVDHWAVTPRLCDAAHRLGLAIAAWTVNSPRRATRMASCGVDFLTTDRVPEMRAALAWNDGPATAGCDG